MNISRYHYYFIFLYSILYLLSSCVSSSSNTEEGELSEESDLMEEDLPLEEVLEEGFCHDDIYGTYLINKYKKEQLKELKNKKISKSKQRSIDNKALFYARNRLVGVGRDLYVSIPAVMNESVEFWIRYFQTVGRSTFTKWLVTSYSYEKVIKEVLEKEGVPEDLFFLAMIESGFNNHAYSSKKAVGTWQFMRGTAKLYDLKITYWVDERQDPVKATVAAAKYLKDLYSRFGDWYLAMMAYNAGPGKIQRAIRKLKSSDWWKIVNSPYIKAETKNYVPKMLATFFIVASPKTYGFDAIEKETERIPNYTVEVTRPVRLEEISTKLNYPLEGIKKWNPELIAGITPPSNNGRYQLRLKEELADKFYEIRDSLSKLSIKDVKMHTIKKGDTLIGIAKKYRVSVPSIREYNPNLSDKRLRLGRQIAIPVPDVVSL